MGWSQRLHGTEVMEDEEVEAILDAIEAKHVIPEMTWTKQSWGWSTECDITKSKGEPVRFSGAGFSFDTNLPERFKGEAERRGYACDLDERSY